MGHIFVVQGDLSKLVVDAAIIPCDGNQTFHQGFSRLLHDQVQEGAFDAGGTSRFGGSYRRPRQGATVRCDGNPGLWSVLPDQLQRDTPPTWMFNSSRDTNTRLDDAQVDALLQGILAAITLVPQNSPTGIKRLG
jgi:hypothetical protein